MSLSKEISEILDNQRVIINSRRALCRLRIQSFGLWAAKFRRAGFEDSGEMIEKTFVGYFEQELVSLDYLEGVLTESQRIIVESVSKLEVQNG